MPNDEQLNRRYRPLRCQDLVHGTVRARRTGGEEWRGLHLWVPKGTPSPTEKRIPQGCLRRIALLCPVYEKDHRAGAYGCLVRYDLVAAFPSEHDSTFV